MLIFVNFLVLHNLLVDAKYNEAINLENLKRLAQAFPKHKIDVQIEARQEIPRQIPNYKRFREHFQRNSPYLRSGNRGQDTPLPASSAAPSTVTTTATTTTISTSTQPTSTTLKTNTIPNTEPSVHTNRPLYMEDLKEALIDFEEKLRNKMKNWDASARPSEDPNRLVVIKDLWNLEKDINCDPKSEDSSQGFQLNNRDSMLLKLHDQKIGPRMTNFNDQVIRLIQKGVKVQLEITTPSESADEKEAINWVPINIIGH